MHRPPSPRRLSSLQSGAALDARRRTRRPRQIDPALVDEAVRACAAFPRVGGEYDLGFRHRNLAMNRGEALAHGSAHRRTESQPTRSDTDPATSEH